MRIIFYFQICFLSQLYPLHINGEQAICSTLPLFEFVEDCDADDSISNYKIQSQAKKGHKSLNGHVQILFNECCMSDALKLKRCIRIASILRR